MCLSIRSFLAKANSAPALANRHPSGKASINSALAASFTDSSRKNEGLIHVNFTVVCRASESPVTYAPNTAWRTFCRAMRSSCVSEIPSEPGLIFSAIQGNIPFTTATSRSRDNWHHGMSFISSTDIGTLWSNLPCAVVISLPRGFLCCSPAVPRISAMPSGSLLSSSPSVVSPSEGCDSSSLKMLSSSFCPVGELSGGFRKSSSSVGPSWSSSSKPNSCPFNS